MKLNLTRPLVFFDIETTGINIVTDRIVEICILKISPNDVNEIKIYRINPTIPIPQHAIDIHGIKDEEVKDCPKFSDVAKEIAQFIGNADLAGYNSLKFDIPILIEEFTRADMSFSVQGRKLIDVKNIFHKMEQRTLSAAYKFYCSQELSNAHSAEADTTATYEVLKAQIERYEKTPHEDKNGKIFYPIKNDLQALHDFSMMHNNVDLVGHIIYNDQNVEIFNFGKYKNEPVEKIFQKEPQYYDWMMKADFPASTKQIITAIKLRGFNKGCANIEKN